MTANSLKYNKKGLTLIECLISIVVLGIMVTGGLALFHSAEKIMGMSMHKKMALGNR